MQMKISTKVQYGLRAMAYLAQNSVDNRAVSVREIAIREKIPADYLEKIFAKLLKAKMLAAKKGVRGGYIMARPAGKIKISEIFSALENPATKVKCIDGKCARQNDCLTKCIWIKRQEAVNDFLESVTLEDMILGKFEARSLNVRNKSEFSKL
jgi:Rrf2 family transcriptional regulator, iron-sulfur cluster assembly transcription factor